MPNNKQKLELTWIGKNNPEYDIANIEPRILEEKPELSNCANDPNTENMIIHGDNLLALKALLPEYEGSIKCIYIDPPYNTGNAFEHYDDSVEHSTWLSLMKPRLELLKILLNDEGIIFVHLDDIEMHYCKVLMDEVFGRQNFVGTLIHQRAKGGGQAKYIVKGHDYVTVFAKNLTNNIALSRPKVIQGKTIIKDGKEYLLNDDVLRKVFGKYDRTLNDRRCFYEEILTYKNQEKKDEIDNKIKTGEYFLQKNKFGMHTICKLEPANSARSKLYSIIKVLSEDGKKELDAMSLGDFPYPKPEEFVQQIIDAATKETDFVLDSFLGSGTTAAVAHKMGRSYIGIEMGEHAYTHCKVRLDKVIDGSDQGGISKAVNWQGGGAYKFYELAPSFIVKDEFGNPVIDGFYNDVKLIKAMCKLMNFTYRPSQTEYWKHGAGQGKNYLYITTQLLTCGMVRQIAAHLLDGESLIICPKNFEPGADKIDGRITIKKIPQSVLKACHFGKKEYLLPIKETAMEEVDIEAAEENND